MSVDEELRNMVQATADGYDPVGAVGDIHRRARSIHHIRVSGIVGSSVLALGTLGGVAAYFATGPAHNEQVRSITQTSTTSAPVPSSITATTTVRNHQTTTTEMPTSSTTPTTVQVRVGLFADTFHFHVTAMVIDPDGSGTASWRVLSSGGTESYMAQGTFHLTSVTGRYAAGVVDTSTSTATWAPGQRFELELQSNDMLIVTPKGPFAPMCGSSALQESQAGNPPPGVNCGA